MPSILIWCCVNTFNKHIHIFAFQQKTQTNISTKQNTWCCITKKHQKPLKKTQCFGGDFFRRWQPRYKLKPLTVLRVAFSRLLAVSMVESTWQMPQPPSSSSRSFITGIHFLNAEMLAFETKLSWDSTRPGDPTWSFNKYIKPLKREYFQRNVHLPTFSGDLFVFRGARHIRKKNMINIVN